MPAVLYQSSLSSTPVLVAALVVLILVAALAAWLVIRSTTDRRKRSERVGERLLEMEREAQFAASADNVQHSREVADVAARVSELLRQYLSMQVMAIYAGRDADEQLSDVLLGLDRRETGPVRSMALPASVPAALLREYPGPAIGKLGSVANENSASLTQAEETPNIEAAASIEDSASTEDAMQTSTEAPVGVQTQAGKNNEEDILLPWSGPFGWNGLIVASVPAGFQVETLEPNRVPLGRLTDRLAVALEVERSDAACADADRRASKTTSFSRSLISSLEKAAPLDVIIREVAAIVGSDSAALWRIDERSSMIRMVSAYGLKSAEFLPLPVGQGLAGCVTESGDVLSIEDAPGDPRCIFPREAQEAGVVSYLGAPLVSDGKPLGAIEVHAASRRSWSENEIRTLESAAVLISEVIKSTDSRVNRLRVENAYLGLSEALQRLRSPDELKEAVVEVLGHALGASRVLVVEFSNGHKAEPVKQEYRQSSAKSALGANFAKALSEEATALAAGKPIVINDSSEKSLFGPQAAAEFDLLSELAVPIKVDGKPNGIIYVHQCDRRREWDEEEIEFGERVVCQLSLSLSNLRALEHAFNDAAEARAVAQRAAEATKTVQAQLAELESTGASPRIKELEQKLEALDRVLNQSRNDEEQARTMLAKASALEAKARAEANVSRRAEMEVKEQLERFHREHKQVQGSAQQLLEINRLKSEFIVNAGHEIEASLQSVLGLAELLERGSYGNLSGEQREAVHGIYGWARRIKSDVDWLIEYGSARSRRLESSGGS